MVLIPTLILLAVATWGWADESDESMGPCLTYLPGRFSEFLVEQDGSVLLFPMSDYGVPRVWRNGQWSESRALAVDWIVEDAVMAGRGRWLLAAQSGQAGCLYEYADFRIKRVGFLVGKFEKPTLHLSGDGTAWITSQEGTASSLKDGRTITHALGPKVDKRSCAKYYPPTLSLEMPGRGLLFWSHVQHETTNFAIDPKLRIDGFHVYQNGEWRMVPLLVEKLGGVALRGDNELIAGCRYKGILSIAVDHGIVTEVNWPLPRDEHCLFLHRTPNGHFLMITARSWESSRRLSPKHEGWVGALLGVKDNQPQTLLAGVDFKRVLYDKGRPVMDMSEGAFLAEAQSGLLFVSADFKTVKRMDWRFGIPVPNIDRMRSFKNCLYILDRERGFAALDWQRLLRMTETPGSADWSLFTAATPPMAASDGSVWYLTANERGEMRHCVGTNETKVSLEGTSFAVHGLWYATMDTKNRPWLISHIDSFRVLFLDNDKYRVFENRETAYSTVALEEIGNPWYRIGNPSEHCYPAFAGDGRVAYQNEWNRICFFDGAKWDSSHREGRIDGRSPEGPPFYVDGVLTVRAGDSYYQLVDGKWQIARKDVNSPYGDKPRQVRDVDLPRSFPGDLEKCSIRVRDNMGTLWAGNADNLYRGLGDVWAPFPVENTPIRMASGISKVHVDGVGRIWFTLEGGDYQRLARYDAKGSPPKLEWEEEPAVETTTDSFRLSVRITGPAKRHIAQHQMDDDDWQQTTIESARHEMLWKGLANGIHACRVQVFDELLRGSAIIEHQFEVKRDYDGDIQKFLLLLQSPDYSERERAVKALAEIGNPAMPALNSLEQRAEPSLQWWIRAVKDEVNRRP